MKYTMQNQGDATTGREILRASRILLKLFLIELTSLSNSKFYSKNDQLSF